MRAVDFASLCEQELKMTNYGLIGFYPDKRIIYLNKVFYKLFNTWYYETDDKGKRRAYRKESFYDKESGSRIEYTFITFNKEDGTML